ncbi:flagellar filament capping protein FliD [Neobacillus sp. M.A.Huq-85]
MDTDSIVQQMVKAQSTKLNKLQQAKTLNSWKTDAYRDVNTKLADFRSSIQNLRLQSTFNKKTVTSSQPDLVGVSISGAPTASSYTLTVNTPATPAQNATVSFSGSIADRTSKVGTDFSFDLTGTGTQTISISKDDTIDGVITKINTQSATTGVKASYFDGNGSIVFSTVATGATANIKIENVGANNLGITNGIILKDADPTVAVNQQNFTNQSVGADVKPGQVTINGLSLTINSNSFTYDGVKYDLKAPNTGQTVSVQTTNDTQSAFDSIKTLVDKYNQLISDLNSKISEQKYRDYPPLTDDQKKDMKDTDITLWENKAKSGLLNNDSNISSLLQQMRTSLSQAVGGITDGPKSLSDIGITTSNNYQDNGKLVLDEAKLKSALDSNLLGVQNLFTKKSTLGSSSDTTATSSEKSNDSGFGWRIYDRVNSALSDLATIAGSPTSAYTDTKSLMAKQLKSITDNLTKEQNRISQYETNLYKKFSDMETALTKLNSQSNWLTQQLGG